MFSVVVMIVLGLLVTNSIYLEKFYIKNKKEKLVTIHNISNKCSMCPLIIHGTPLTKAFAWNCGIGSLTGSGCGSII